MRNLFGFLLGIIVGAIGALLFVPLVGKEFVVETQTRLQEAYRHFEINLWDIAHDVKDEVTTALRDGKPIDDASDASEDVNDHDAAGGKTIGGNDA